MPETNPTGSPVSIREFRIEDAEAVHRWFNNPEATKTLMEQRDSFDMENAEGWTRAAAAGEGNDRKYAIVVPGSSSRSGSPPSTGFSSRWLPSWDA